MDTQDAAPNHGASTTSKPQPKSIPQIAIAVMGATGSGKTSFVNMASGSDLRIGMELESCTAEVQLANEFLLDERPVILIDTPGFDDTNKSDTDVLRSIAAFLATAYEAGSTLAGVIYIHPISNKRFSGIAKRNFNMFRELCGDTTLKNVIFVTNMWGEVPQDVGEAREMELTTNFFEPALGKGAQLARYYNTVQSTHDIIRSIMKNKPAPLRIQRELVEERKDIVDTAAGETINKELNEEIRRHRAELDAMKEEEKAALKKKDDEIRKAREKKNEEVRKALEEQRKEMMQEFEDGRRELQEEISRMKKDSEMSNSEFQEEKRKWEEARKKLEQAEAKAEADRRRMEDLSKQLQEATASAAEKEEIKKQIRDLQHQWDTRPRGGGCLIM